MQSNGYFIHGGRLYHPTNVGISMPNSSTLADTYVEKVVKKTPSFYDFGTDYSNQQNTEDETDRRRYFFPPSFI
jgi:hypothetical protein